MGVDQEPRVHAGILGATQVASGRLPLHVLTGFLGSGKTALLRSLLERIDERRRDGRTERIAVLVNEVGELGLDHHLLERVDEDVLMLPGGCVCCSMRGELHEALERVRALEPSRIVLETTGLAEPAPLLHSVGSDPRLAETLELAGVIAVADCVRVEELLESHPEVRRQLDFADRVVLSKSDLAPERVEAVRALLEREAPGREVRVADRGAVDPDWLLAPAGFGRANESDGDGASGATRWLRSGPLHTAAPGAGHPDTTTHSIEVEHAIDVEALQLWLRLVVQLDGNRLLRIKSLVRCASTGAVFALQSAGRSVSPPQRVAVVPAGLRGAQVVVIERGMPAGAMRGLLDSLRSALLGGSQRARVTAL